MAPEVPGKQPRRAARYTAGMTIARLWVPLCLAGLVAACGQKGPLVHPDAPKHKKAMPSPRTPVPATTAPETKASDAPQKP
jgi:predicted small lipoprotein YifL